MELDKFNTLKHNELPEAGKINYPGNSINFKTGDWKINAPKWSIEKCMQCGLCWAVCPEDAIYVDKEKQKLTHIEYDYCKGCGICVKACPFKALNMVKLEEIESEKE